MSKDNLLQQAMNLQAARNQLSRQREALYKSLFDNAPVGILNLECDMLEECTIREINNAALKVMGYADQDLEGRIFYDLFPKTIADDLKLQIASCLDQQMSIECEVTFRNQTGSHKYLEFLFTAIDLEGETGRYIQVIVLDTTRRKLAEEALNQSQKIQAIGQLSGGMAHDFNNRLTVITGNLELLQRKLADRDDVQPLLQEAMDSAFSSSVLTRQLLAFSRKQTLYPESINCNQRIRELRHMLERTLGDDIKLKIHLDENAWMIYADVTQFDTAIVNFALNARDALPQGGSVTIETENVWLSQKYTNRFLDLRPGPYVKILVNDNGVGIDPVILPRVMDPFFTTKEVGDGSGLGLSTAYGFAKQSKGHLDIESVVNYGTTVCLYLPRYEGRIREGQNRPQTTFIDDGGPINRALPEGRGQAILVVEDDEQLRQVVVNMLSELHYQTFEAENAVNALAILQAQPSIDLVFADIVMPGDMNGIDLAQQIEIQYPGMPVLLATGYASRRGPMNQIPPHIPVLAKPYRLQALAENIHSLIDQ